MTVIIYNFITRQLEMMILVKKKNWLVPKIRKIAKLKKFNVQNGFEILY